MKKKILLTGLLLFILFFLIPISTLCVSANQNDPENDVLILEGYNYQFNLETFSVNDALIKQIKDLKFVYTYTSNIPTLDITKMVIDNQGSDTEFIITVKEACVDYPSGDSNIFVLVVVIEYEDTIFGAVHIKHSSLGSISKYGYFSDLAEFPHIVILLSLGNSSTRSFVSAFGFSFKNSKTLFTKDSLFSFLLFRFKYFSTCSAFIFSISL